MRSIRVLPVASLLLIGLYFVFRAIAAQCNGAACDVYIPVSLLIPIAILLMVAITGVFATAAARGNKVWFAVLLTSTFIGVAGPIVALLVLRDRPDAFVATATVLELIVPVAALGYSLPLRSRNKLTESRINASRF